MKHTEIALARPVTTMVIFVALSLIGLLASRLLPLEMLPDIEWPGIYVEVPYPGSTPEEVERLITRPVEEALATLPGVERMRSWSGDSRSQVQLEFGWDQDMGAKGIEARAKLDSIRHLLPDDVRRVFVFTGSVSDQPVIEVILSSEADLQNSYELLDRNVKRRLERIDGVSKVEMWGVDPREVRILLKPDQIAAYGVDLLALRDLLTESNFSVSAGKMNASGQRLSVRPKGEFQSVDEIRSLVINAQGLRLDDVADIELVAPDRHYGRRLDGEPSIVIGVSRNTGANLVEVTDAVVDEIERISAQPQLSHVSFLVVDNQGANVKQSLADLLEAGLLGGLLAILVLYLFLRHLTTTLIVTASVPFSLLITLGALYFSGLSLNILSMMGIMLAVGMLVDNAVVVTESIFRYREKDPDNPERATLKGVREVGLAVVAGTATTIIVFAPIIVGEKAEIMVFLTHVAVTIIVALLASLAIAQTMVPMLASRVKNMPAPKPGALMGRLTRRYERALRWVVVHPKWSFLGILVICAIGVAPMMLELVKVDMFPRDDERRIYMPYRIQGTHALDTVAASVDEIENYLHTNREALNIETTLSVYTQSYAHTVMLLTKDDEVTKSVTEIRKEIDENLPKIAIGRPGFESQQQGGSEGFSLQVSGDSTVILNELGDEVVRALSSLEGLSNVRSDEETGEREVRVVIDRDRAATAGLTAEQVAQMVGVAMRGEILSEFRGPDGEVGVRMAFRENERQSVEQLANLPLFDAMGNRITLGSLSDFEMGRTAERIRRTDRQTSVIISADVEDDFSMNDLRPQVSQLMDALELPAGYSWKFGRGFQRNDETQAMMMTNLLLGVACIFLVMAALFESLILPFSIILGSIVFSIFGVFLFFAATGTPFSFMAMIGIMILIGVVVNNGIVLVDHINNLRVGGMHRNEAIVIGGRDRLRPILMTVATTIVGLTPLAIGNTQVGGDGPPYYPMARAIIGGLAFSTVVSLLVVPALYIYFDNLAAWSRKVRRLARGEALPGSTPAA
ncbi:MAG: efflux RND transporter permease subunit [Pseudomonadota bacterium]